MRGIIYCADPMFKEVESGDTTTSLATVMRAMIFMPVDEFVLVSHFTRAGILHDIARRHDIHPLFYFIDHSLDILNVFTDDVNLIAFGEERLPLGAFKQLYVRPNVLWGKTSILVRNHVPIGGAVTRNVFQEVLSQEFGVRKALQALMPRASIFEVKSTL